MKKIIRIEDQFYILANSVEIQNRVLKSNELFAIFNNQGSIRPLGFENQGLYYEGTRFLSRLSMNLEDRQLLFLSSTVNKDNDSIAIDLTNTDIEFNGDIILKRGTVHFFDSMFLDDQCCYKRIRIVNYGVDPVEFNFTFEFEADYADIFEVRGLLRKRRGRFHSPQILDHNKITLIYEGLDNIFRRTHIEFSPTPMFIDSHSARFYIKLDPYKSTEIYLTVLCQAQEAVVQRHTYDLALSHIKSKYTDMRSHYGYIETSNKQFNYWLERSTTDFFMMLTQTQHGLYPFAGIPWFSTVFGRDGIITAMEVLWLYPHIARSVLTYLAYYQAEDLNYEQDAEPGKILHEERKGEMANLKEIPFGCYYGSVDSTPLFLILCGYYYRRSGDLAFIEGLWPAIEKALDWCYRYGDADGDGFIEYERKAVKGGLIQQGWKDSEDSIFHHNGKIAAPPIALSEVQGYYYEAKIQIAYLAQALDKKKLANKLLTEAKDLQAKFEKQFWCEDIGTYALALDGNKQPCRVLSSNAGQCLFTGIASKPHARRIIEQLTEKSFFNGWGIRTIASSESRYNPMSYHNGSVWPHDNALIAYGMSRYGHKKAALKVLTGLFEASFFMDSHRLPELFCGFPRRPEEGPTLYPVACNPQSWSSVSVFMLLQSCLGLNVDGLKQKIDLISPALPDFLDYIKIHNLQVGKTLVDLTLFRQNKKVTADLACPEDGKKIKLSNRIKQYN